MSHRPESGGALPIGGSNPPPELAWKEFFTAEAAAAFAQKSLNGLFDQAADNIHYDDAIWQSEAGGGAK